MPYQDLRAFLEVLRKEGELLEIDRPMHLDNEIPKALKQISEYGGPALVFTGAAWAAFLRGVKRQRDFG